MTLEKNSSDEYDISICDIMKNRTSEIVKKMEYQLPLMTQQFSDLYTACLHSFDDVFGTCYISQKEFIDKLNIPQEVLREFDKSLTILSKSCQNLIDLNSMFWQNYVQTKLSAIKSNDQFVHMTMNSYAQTLANFNAMINSAKPNKFKPYILWIDN